MIFTTELNKSLLSGPDSTAGHGGGGGRSIAEDVILYYKWWYAFLSTTPYPLQIKPSLQLHSTLPSPFRITELTCLPV